VNAWVQASEAAGQATCVTLQNVGRSFGLCFVDERMVAENRDWLMFGSLHPRSGPILSCERVFENV